LNTETSTIAGEQKAQVEQQSPLILLPGLGGDTRLFDSQRPAFPELITLNWIEPKKNEPLADYAARYAKVIDPGQPCFIGGVSFGGVVALEVASHLAARECFLIGSIRSTNQMPWRLKVLRPISDLIILPRLASPWLLSLGGNWLNPIARGALHQLKDADRKFLQWAAGAILSWTPSAGVADVPVVQIHGTRDRVFPIGRVSADKTIPGAGHLVSLTHSKAVNQYLRERMSIHR
jgi:pimeloyl-ACP methyl ester carboxylesterase